MSIPSRPSMCDLRNFFGNAAGQRLFFSEKDSDVAIQVAWEGQKWHFPGHKLILCTMSEVLRTMLETDMIEKRTKIITIRDSHPFAVKQFLRYLYIGVVDFNGWSEAMNLLKIAHKYGVQTLVNLTETYLVSTIVFSNACTLYELARTYSLKTLKKQTHLFILDSAFVVSSTDGFFNMRPKSLETFLGSSFMNMENEGSVLTCLREWAVCECSRRCMTLSRTNVLSAMEPFFKHIRWELIPELHRTFVPRHLTEKYKDQGLVLRKSFHVPSSLQYYVNYIKFVVELGTYFEERAAAGRGLNFNCLKMCVDNHTFMVGFRIVGLFRIDASILTGPSFLILSREDKVFIQFNLNSLSWTRGSTVGGDIWRELIAYLPYPIRVDPFNTYTLSIRCAGRSKETTIVKWPRTRLDSEVVTTDLGTINFRAYGPSFGITQLFMLPAPPYRNVCNHSNDH